MKRPWWSGLLTSFGMGVAVILFAVMMLAWLITDTSMRVWPDVVQQGELK